MKKAINAWAFPGTMTFAQIFDTAKKYGFEAIELNFDPVGSGNHCLSFDTTSEEIAQIKALIKESGIEVESISSSMYGRVGAFASKEAEKRDEAISVLKKHLQLARDIGANSILVVPHIAKGLRLKECFDNTIEVFRSLKEDIASYGVKIGLENVWNCFFSSPYDIQYVLDGIDDENVGLYFDLGNMVEFADTDWWVDAVGKYVVKVHVKDFKRANGYRSGGSFCDLLEGDLDWKSAIPKLAKYYDGPLTAELSQGSRDADEFYPKLSRALDEIIAMSKLGG